MTDFNLLYGFGRLAKRLRAGSGVTLSNPESGVVQIAAGGSSGAITLLLKTEDQTLPDADTFVDDGELVTSLDAGYYALQGFLWMQESDPQDGLDWKLVAPGDAEGRYFGRRVITSLTADQFIGGQPGDIQVFAGNVAPDKMAVWFSGYLYLPTSGDVKYQWKAEGDNENPKALAGTWLSLGASV